jgi:hypothetical protein
MPIFNRRRNTPAMAGRSSAMPVSFSTIDARVRASLAFFSGRSSARDAQASSSAASIALCARLSRSRSLSPFTQA